MNDNISPNPLNFEELTGFKGLYNPIQDRLLIRGYVICKNSLYFGIQNAICFYTDKQSAIDKAKEIGNGFEAKEFGLVEP